MTAWDDVNFVNAWNETYGLDMSRAPIRSGLIFPLLAEKIGDFDGLTLADLGCGNGNLIRYFQKAAFAQWDGIDGGKAVIESAARHTHDARVRYTHADLTAPLPLPCHTYDVVTSVFVVEEIPQQKLAAMFGNISRLLKRDGQAFVFTNHPAYALLQDIAAAQTNSVNTKFSNHNGYFDREPTTYALSVLNQQESQPVMVPYHHKTFSDILNAAAESGLAVAESGEVPAGVITLENWKSHQPRSGDTPRFLFQVLKPL